MNATPADLARLSLLSQHLLDAEVLSDADGAALMVPSNRRTGARSWKRPAAFSPRTEPRLFYHSKGAIDVRPAKIDRLARPGGRSGAVRDRRPRRQAPGHPGSDVGAGGWIVQ